MTTFNFKQIREAYSRRYEQKYLELTLKILNKLEFNKIKNLKTILRLYNQCPPTPGTMMSLLIQFVTGKRKIN